MIYVIKRVGNNTYFNKNIGFQNHWTYKSEAKQYFTKRELKKDVKRYNIKNYVIEEW